MRGLRRALVFVTLSLVALGIAVAGILLSVYTPAATRVAEVLAAIPAEENPPPAAFSELARCVHPVGIEFHATRRLLEAETDPQEPRWAGGLRLAVWARAVRQRSDQDGMALLAHTLLHPGGSGLVSAAHAAYAKGPAELSREETLELLLYDRSPSLPSEALFSELRARCLARDATPRP